MGNISGHFERIEFACKCLEDCGHDTADIELVQVLEDLRNSFGVPVVVTSAHRCATHNAAIGGAVNSQHLRGKAADVVVPGYASQYIYDWLDKKYPDKYGLGISDSFVHIDVRPKKARWTY